MAAYSGQRLNETFTVSGGGTRGPVCVSGRRRGTRMSAVGRRLINLLTLLSLLLCATVVALWVWSSGAPRTWVLSAGADRAVLVRSAGGSLQVGRQSVERIGAGLPPDVRFNLSEPGAVVYATPGAKGSFANGWYDPRGGLWSAGWTDVAIHSNRYRLRCSRLRLSYALMALVTAALPAAWLAVRTWQRRRSALRDRRQLCACCGYDLRATPDRCPECGTSTTTPA